MNANRPKAGRGTRSAARPLPNLPLPSPAANRHTPAANRHTPAADRSSRHTPAADRAPPGLPDLGSAAAPELTRPDPRVDGAGSGTRRRSSQPRRAAVEEPVPPPAAPRPPRAKVEAEELDTRVFALVTAVAEADGRGYPPEWAAVADAAKRRGYLEERGLRLYLKTHGRQWLSSRAAPAARAYTMTKIDPATRLALKDLSHDTGVPMQEAIGHIIGAVWEHRAELRAIAFRAGEEYPWEAIGALLRERRK